ncbi:exodeoxyribonuclease VII large subunit [Curvibacter sp. APW13]|uniref:exodeoxyribonuclease VII large subunit n=1 Tax=Curvibacter sp. APW13 TaxID=3077236 RepID=UPI0028DDD809|nr:exodeoxyribonuclease VII large subunit [Curvibacter sp. APW13]MDT8992097.1 exodeoxyribonuclease VII large subunit [Curvibacter sp. APW13]
MDDQFNPIRVVGEISGFVQASSGHCYFTLKDAESQLRCAMFRRAAMGLARLPVNGDKVEVQARLGLHAARGDLQLVVEDLRPAGQGDHLEQFLRLKAKLEAQGLFDPMRKRPLLSYPACIGVVTSPDAAALSDVLTALGRRSPHLPVVFSPCAVQGADAPAAIIAALESLYALATDASAPPLTKPEVILLVRGGGAWEDLQAFNDEAVAQCIARSPVPVVSGVGHETDFTIADFVADIRAATPTAAAELCASPHSELMQTLDVLETHLSRALDRTIQANEQQLDAMTMVLSRPAHGLATMAADVEQLAHRLSRGMQPALAQADARLNGLQVQHAAVGQRVCTFRSHSLAQLGVRLEAASPTQALSRGFAWLQGPKGLVTSVHQLAAGDPVTATLADGMVEMQVLRS